MTFPIQIGKALSWSPLLFFFLVTLTGGLNCAPVLASDGNKTLAPIYLQLRWLHQFQFAGYYAAIEQGYYREMGLDVRLKEGGVNINTIREVLDGDAQYGVTNSEILLHKLKGEPLVALAAVFQHSPLVFVSRTATGITTPQDMVGKTVQMMLASRDVELHATLQNEGIELAQLNIINRGGSRQDYLNPRIDVLGAYLTNQTKYFKDEGIPYTIIKPAVYGVDFYGDCLFTTRAELSKNPDRVAFFRSASLRGWHYAMAHPEEIIDLIIEKYNPQAQPEKLRYEAEKMQELILPDLVELGHMNPGRWVHIASVFKDQEMVPQDASLDGFIYDPSRQKDYTLFLIIIGVLGCISMLIGTATFSLYHFNRKLKNEIDEHTRTTKALVENRRKVETYSRQIEQFSLAATSGLHLKDVPAVGKAISEALVKNSDYKRVLISLFTQIPPYREIIGYAGIDEQVVERLKNVELPANCYDHIFQEGIKFGRFSYYVPHTMKDILKQEATDYGSGAVLPDEDNWHPEDNLFVKMSDKDNNFIGVISVDESKSGQKPNDELVGPLEIFSSLASQIIELKRESAKRQQLEEQLRQAHKMEAVGNLTGGIAHDFNNILSAVLGNAEIALLNPELDQRSRKHFVEIQNAGKRARDIVQQLLSFSRKTVEKKVPINLGDIIEESLTFLRSTIPTTIVITARLAETPIITLANQTQIYQIMINLCTNAAHAMEEGGEISVILDKVEKSSREMARIQIIDTGCGIDPEILDRIFDPYFTTKSTGKGTGIGLAVVHGIISGHDGTIEVSSAKGKGTCFTVFLPSMGRDAPEAKEQDLQAASHRGKGHILFVDDEIQLLQIGREMLEYLGYAVSTYPNPREALRQFTKAPQAFTLIISDFTMPAMTGEQFAKEILAIAPQLPVIITSGYNEKLSQTKAEAMGIKGYLPKPFTLERLAETVRHAL